MTALDISARSIGMIIALRVQLDLDLFSLSSLPFPLSSFAHSELSHLPVGIVGLAVSLLVGLVGLVGLWFGRTVLCDRRNCTKLPQGEVLRPGEEQMLALMQSAFEKIRLLESVVVNANDSVVITEAAPIDAPGPRILYVNQAFTQQTGYILEEVMGKTPRILQGSDSDRQTLKQIRAALEQWQPIRVDVLNYRKDRSTYWAELSIVPVADETGWFTHWIAIQRDITERKAAETEIRNALEQEKELRELKSRFVSMVSHEFRTPLATIMASSDLLKNFSYALSEEKKLERLNKIQTQVRVMTRLMEDVLLMGQIEADRVQFTPIWLDLKQLCQDILDETRLLMSNHHTLSFICSEDQRLGRDTEPEYYARVDEKLLTHILTNLLSNAIKYSPQGGAITLELHCDPATLMFQVQDTGVGIPELDQDKLFTPFYRASNVGQLSGTGLGLAIIKRAAELHGGSIQVSSRVGVGSTFTVFIPRLSQKGYTL